MNDQIETRLAQLQQEFELGQRRLGELEVQQVQLRETLLRIDGAMQVLRELLITEERSIPAPGPELVAPAPVRAGAA